jgi:hypothetical protein
MAYSGPGWKYADLSPAGVIPDFAFYNASSGTGNGTLTTIFLPRTMSGCGTDSFSNCLKIKDIFLKNVQTPLFSFLSFQGVDLSHCRLHVPKGTHTIYQQTEGWNRFQIIEEK